MGLRRRTRGLRVFKKLTWKGRRYQIRRALGRGIVGRQAYQRRYLKAF